MSRVTKDRLDTTLVDTTSTQTLTGKTLTTAGNTITGLGIPNFGGITGAASATTALRGDGFWYTFTNGTVTSVSLTAPSILSVGGSPVTGSGSLALTLATQTPNQVWAGPASGSTAAAPAFRNLVTADLPAGTGTVTSVAATVPAALLAVAGTPITTSGTLAFTLATQTANQVFAGPTNGTAVTPTFRSLVAADIPSISLATGVNGTLPTANGGTNLTGFTTGDILYASSSTALSKLAIGANNQILSIVSGLPSWITASAGSSGTVTSVSVTSANGFAGTVATATTTPAITLTTTLTGSIQGNGTALTAISNTGTGNNVLATSPTLVTPALGTPASGVATNLTGLPLTTGVTGILPVANGGTGDSGTAWTAYAPTLTAGSGTFTSATAAGRYKQIGKTVFLNVQITITTNGTAATDTRISLPVTANSSIQATLNGRETSQTGFQIVGTIGNINFSTIQIRRYDNTYIGANGYVIVVTGVYEAA